MDILKYCPVAPEWKIDWTAFEAENEELIGPLQETEQDPFWHGEGNVWNHTRMVLDALSGFEEWRNLERIERENIYLAGLLHDIGKPTCTRRESGRIISPKHAIKGSFLARSLLWKRFGMSGSEENMKRRETIVSMIRLHSLPYSLIDRTEPLLDVVRASCFLRNDFLGILSKADITGRKSDKPEKSLENLEFFVRFCEENDCLDKPYPFASHRSRYVYFSGKLEHPVQELYDDTWGEVVLMSGLPASGKDCFIEKNYKNREVISLDAIRESLGLGWLENQSPIIESAKKKAKVLLREKIPFVWNATNISREIRGSLIRSFNAYGARVRIVYLETGLEKLLKRNRERKFPVNESTIMGMIDKLDFPSATEADNIEYHIN